MITTTLKKLKPYLGNTLWQKLLNSLGKKRADDKPLKFSTIIESLGLEEAIWCLRSISPEHDKELRLFAADCAESVLHIFEKEYPDDKRPRQAIEAARKYANGEITKEELKIARNAAMRVALDARNNVEYHLSYVAYAAAYSANAPAIFDVYVATVSNAASAADIYINDAVKHAKFLVERFS